MWEKEQNRTRRDWHTRCKLIVSSIFSDIGVAISLWEMYITANPGGIKLDTEADTRSKDAPENLDFLSGNFSSREREKVMAALDVAKGYI